MRLPILLALIASPAWAADPVPVAGDDLFPLAVGRSWTYRVTGGPGPEQRERFVVRVAGEEMVGETRCFRLEASLGDRVVATEYVAPTADGVCRFRVEKEIVVPPVPFVKPLKDGAKTTWKVADYKIGSRIATATFWADPPADVTVKAGKFKAVKVVAESKENAEPVRRTTVWYAPGVGIVRQQLFGGDGRPTINLELESFEK